ncbi:MAG: hypothetical protein AAFU41_03270 [Pseudomonadota bacterium]
MAEGSGRVRQRRVFHIPGYDPFPARRYRELYRKEAAAQAEISGYRIAVKGVEGASGTWVVATETDGAQARARVDVLTWSDIVQDSMAGSIPATYWQMLTTALIYLRSGTLRRLMMLRKGPVIAAFYPVAMLLGQLALALIVAGVLGGLVESGLLTVAALVVGTEGTVYDTVTWIGWVLNWAIFIALTVVILRWCKAQDHRLYAYYLMHDYAFSAGRDGAYPQAMEDRLQDFRSTLAAAMTDDVDEVLIVGHSSGAHLAVSIVADMVRAGLIKGDGPRLALLTLGQVIPMLSFLPRARRLRGDLALLQDCEAITWVDVSAPGDGCSFALCDPVAVTGLAKEGKRWPLVISAAFTQTLSPARWKALRWRFFRLHFQYLCAFDRPGDYDYFQITAGPQTLAARYAGRGPSGSRIDVPVSKYTSVQS